MNFSFTQPLKIEPKIMCGITGIYYSKLSPRSQHDIETTLNNMTDSIVHRGPDSKGIWIDPICGAGLGHQRLAIRDLSPTGHQPMISSCGRYVIVYNGEVYSHQEIAADLTKCQRHLKGNSDTEVILEACAQWGVETAVKRLVGMFAFALYDREDHTLILVRDRLGIKPLYYGIFNGMLIFGSELKALRANPNWQPHLNRNAVADLARYKYIPGPASIYQNVYKLQPGHMLKINAKGEYKIFPFWNLYTIREKSATTKSKKSDKDLLKELHDLLNDAVKRRMVSDVPIGSLLSGGIDSSLVTALMSKNSNNQINTFSIGFNESKYNEAHFAKEVAKHLGTNHHELYVNAHDTLNLVNELPKWYDEPFADHSQIPTLMLCAMAKKNATVVLSGDGGDELFAGYERYLYVLRNRKKICTLPYYVRVRISQNIQAITKNFVKYLSQKNKKKLYDFIRILNIENLDKLYFHKCSVWEFPETILINAKENINVYKDNIIQKSSSDTLERMMFIDLLSYLPDDILTKIDRASMSVALEVRVPLIDHRIVEFALQLPTHMKLRNQQTKWALRQILYSYVPQHLIEREKKGFGMPLDPWLRGPLRDWAENLLDENRLKSQELFKHKPVRACWNKFLTGTRCGNLIWIILMTQAWIDTNPEVSL